jgi:aldehyde:ferredoxin oxidoreductase
MPGRVKKEMFGHTPDPTSADPVIVTKWYNELTSVYNSLGICMIAGTVIDALGPTIQSRLYSSATGIPMSPEGLMTVGERIFNLMRAYVVREGVTRDQDHWPSRFYTETSAARAPPFEREEVQRMLDRYYEARGWDIETGAPRPETLKRLDLGTRYRDLL